MHELDPEFRAMPHHSDAWNDVRRWRRAERGRLIGERMALEQDERHARASRIGSRLDAIIGELQGRIVGTYWPLRGEPDLRSWGVGVIGRCGRLALPVVIRKGWPLEYRLWAPGDPLERGAWNIPVPVNGPTVQPHIVIAPLVGFDDAGYRLGYGGGFLDRTLATMPRKPLTIGVGYALNRVRTIYPQPHDIPMDVIVTD